MLCFLHRLCLCSYLIGGMNIIHVLGNLLQAPDRAIHFLKHCIFLRFISLCFDVLKKLNAVIPSTISIILHSFLLIFLVKALFIICDESLKPGVILHSHDPSTWEMETRQWRIQGQPQSQSKPRRYKALLQKSKQQQKKWNPYNISLKCAFIHIPTVARRNSSFLHPHPYFQYFFISILIHYLFFILAIHLGLRGMTWHLYMVLT